jgi:succinate-semialdehyde dehydrogenase/glutarate-semialdehyde dehydrogenase
MDDRPATLAKPSFRTTDPATGQAGRTYEGHTVDEALDIARLARRAFEGWRRVSVAERGRLMHAAAATLRKRKDEFAGLMTAEMGKTKADGLAEVEKCAAACDWFADHAEDYLKPRPATFPGASKAYVTFNPLGVVLAVMPWNFPFWQVLRFAAPTLMAGNAAVLKHASNVPGCALAIEDVFREAGFPENLFRTLLIPSKDVNRLIEDTAIAAVSLTGSVEAGRKVAAAAGAALKKCVLELGGSDPYIVLEDADLDQAAKLCTDTRLVNRGQSCIAGKRFIVVESVREAFEKKFVERMAAAAPADLAKETGGFGPLQSIDARDDVHDQVQRSLAGGARLLLGGAVPDRPGAWYPPTVLTEVKPGVASYSEEVFGPVASIISARDEADAIRIANDSEFGLGSGVITGDVARGERIAAEQLEAGMSFVNGVVASGPGLPFGGVKHSGYGRECAEFGIHEFVNIKSVVIA